MNKCCIQTQHAALTNSSNKFVMYSNGESNTTSHGMSATENCGSVHITEEIRARIKLRSQAAFDFFERTLQLYSVEQLIFCFNGGKDCTVLLDLLMRYCRQQGIGSDEIPMLYIESDDSFEEIDEFVNMCVNSYDVKLIKYKDSLKIALTHMTEDMPLIKGVFVGSRNTDPYCENLQSMQKTDSDWPDIMRLNPLLEWTYHDIWHYIHIHKVPYCTLYAQGYTSIGYKSNTLPNPHLKCENCDSESDNICFKPAWELLDPTQERAGRVSGK